MNFFDLHGPAFLLAYGVLFLIAIIGANAVYINALKVSGGAEAVPRLDPYEVAFLSGGAGRVFLTALTALSLRELITIDETQRTISINPAATRTQGLLPIEADLLDECKRQTALKDLYKHVETKLGHLQEKLIACRLIASEHDRNEGYGMAFLVMLSLPVFVGVPQLINGIIHGKPVVFLVFMIFCTLLATFIICALISKSRLTNLGRDVLSTMQRDNSALQLNCVSCPSTLSPTDLALGFGLFGAAAAATASPFLMARRGLQPATGGSCGGGGCGGSGCGGGGGGCGGGGCGGCGGGCGG